jgi:hypothetical protein
MGLMMTVNPGRKQIWRIANTTAAVTSIVPELPPKTRFTRCAIAGQD